jgi:CHAD domain-containing protein
MATKIAFEGNRELRWLEIGHCLACYMESECEFTDKEWDHWLDAVQRDSISSLIICSWGPTQPTHQQWRRATRLMRDRQLPVSVITDARHNFALAKAASWLGTNIQAHRWQEIGEALGFLGMGISERITVQATLVALRDRFGSVTTDAELGQMVTAPAVVVPEILPASSEVVVEANEEIQRKLAEIQARFRDRSRAQVGAGQD